MPSLGSKLVVLLLSLLLAGVAQAQPTSGPSKQQKKEAEALVGLSEQFIQDGDPAEAAKLLEEAYALDEDPETLFKLAGAYEGMDGSEAIAGAIDAYSRYLEAKPKSDTRELVEERLSALQKKLEAANAREAIDAARKKAAARQKAEEGPGFLYGPWPWAIFIVGASSLAATAVFGTLSIVEHNGAVGEPVHEDAADRQSLAETFALVANATLVAGIVIAGTGATFLTLRWTIPEDEADAASIALGPGFGRVTW